jgi:uncharacterized membrane protein
MNTVFNYIVKRVLTGLLLIIPIYLAILLLIKGMLSLGNLVKPFTHLLPEGFPAEQFLSLLLVVAICFLLGVVIHTRMGRISRDWVEKEVFQKIPGYGLVRSLTQQVTGDNLHNVWKPALVEIEDALVPAFIIEEFQDGRYTIFVPSIPTPFAGAVYIIDGNRVHPLDVPFTEAIKVVSKWGSGAKELVAAMERREAGR